MAPYYADEWEPSQGDVGTTLLTLFSELAEEVTERLDRVPEKHRVSFFETLGFGRKPPQPARLPLSVTVADRAGRNVVVPAGTQAKATGTDGSEQRFEVPTGGTFDATPANLQTVFSVEPDDDAIFQHHETIGGGDEPTALFGPADGENLQEHVFYIGDAERLSVGSDSKLTVEIDTEAAPPRLHGLLRWEYYGERTIDGETVEKWHPFPSQFNNEDRVNEGGLGFGLLLGLSLPEITQTETTDEGNAQLEFYPEGPLTETAVNGIESKWIRVRLPPGSTDELFGLQFGSATTNEYIPPIEVGAAAKDGLEPDLMLQNDVPQTGDGVIRPFGTHPRLQDTFYLASTDALTKTGAEVTVEFTGTGGGSNDEPPVLSWEYFDGEGWSQLDLTNNTTADKLQQGGDIEFVVPNDLSKTTVAGHEGHWIRVRLVGGGYGEVTFEPNYTNNDQIPDSFERSSSVEPPKFTAVSLTYDQTEPPDHAIADNNLDFGPDFPAEAVGSYRPFQPLPTDEQALYLGFDGPLRDGPINLLFEVDDVAYPPTFHPRLRWEYYDVHVETWRPLDVRDGTEGLTERGIVSLVFPEATRSSRALGADRHWIRARVTGESFGVDNGADADDSADRGNESACGRFVETVPPAGKPGLHRPPVRGIYPNAGWVLNRRTIEAEVLGSSDGSINQTFAIGTPPVVGAEVWVDELATLSEGARDGLGERWPDRTELETDAGGEPVAFWVRWERQPDLLDSGPDDRHYTLDPIDGTVAFGDGTRGKIPPRGSDNVRATYETGGGEAGNVPVGSVSGFRQSLAFVESVTNPIAGAAGADAESTAAVTDRGARQLRDRNRAVAPADLERIAGEASREVARTRCLPGMDQDGQYTPGWVTLLVVPDSTAEKPTPSTTLQETVDAELAERAPATLTEAGHLVVRGPSYVSVSVEAELAATGGSISQLEERAREAVRSYLHPLNGGPTGEGWPFGELPCRSDFFELFEGLDRVDHVERLMLRFETRRSRVTVGEGDDDPDTSADALGYAGEQDITATLVDDGGGAS